MKRTESQKFGLTTIKINPNPPAKPLPKIKSASRRLLDSGKKEIDDNKLFESNMSEIDFMMRNMNMN